MLGLQWWIQGGLQGEVPKTEDHNFRILTL